MSGLIKLNNKRFLLFPIFYYFPSQNLLPMKTIFPILAILCSLTATAQVQFQNTTQTIIGEIRKLGFPTATLTQSVTTADTSYTLRYRDMQNWDADKYYDITFKATPEELETIYRAFASVHSQENQKNKSYSIQFTLGQTPVTVKNYTYSGVVMCEVRTPDGYFQLTKGQVQKLFGKK